jgi:glycosyltransferase involved in cell wall biosynthesis
LTRHDLGVVAIGRNEGKRLIACLDSVKARTDNIVYVDSGSIDGSIGAARERGALVVELDLTRPFSAARARNEGFSALRAAAPALRFVQFIDGDCILIDDWLDKATTFIESHDDLAVVCGRRREMYPDASIYNRILDLEWDTTVGEAQACGGDALIRVKALEDAGGFRASLIAGEEPELCLRLRGLGWKVWRLDAEMTLHDAAMTNLRQWWKRAVRSGYGILEVSLLHRTSNTGIWRREILSTICWGSFAPFCITLGILLHPAALTALLVYPFQVCRIAVARDPTASLSWKYALLMMLSKFAALQGILKYVWLQWTGRAASLIEYK